MRRLCRHFQHSRSPWKKKLMASFAFWEGFHHYGSSLGSSFTITAVQVKMLPKESQLFSQTIIFKNSQNILGKCGVFARTSNTIVHLEKKNDGFFCLLRSVWPLWPSLGSSFTNTTVLVKLLPKESQLLPHPIVFKTSQQILERCSVFADT